jgi:hypothetical protein
LKQKFLHYNSTFSSHLAFAGWLIFLGGRIMDIDILVKTYEAGNDPGAINKHDDEHGGMSYGLFQLYSGSGIVQDFISWLSKDGNYYSHIGKLFDGLEATTDAFNTKWQEVTKCYPQEFADAQYQYAKLMYFDKAIEQLAKIGFTPKSDAMQNVIFSCAIQYSPYKVPKLFNEAAAWIGYNDCTKVDDDELLICAIYYIRSTDNWNKGYRKMLHRMFLECSTALNMPKSN